MAYSMEEALSAYGFVYTLANSIPDLKAILQQAIDGKWTAEKLSATVESSAWWNQHADTARNLATMQATDPSTYGNSVNSAIQMITLKAQQLGRKVDYSTARALALTTLVENASWDDQRLAHLITNNTELQRIEGGAYAGDAANYGSHMTELAQNYGVAYSQSWLDTWINEVEMGRNSLDGFEAMVRARAKAQFPQFADQLDAGMTVRDIADPYISTYAQTLEVPETQVTLKDSFIQKALSQTGQDGSTQTAMPMWQFQRLLKDDVRYDSTKQAKTDAFSALNKIGKDWGFVGASA